MSTVQTPPATEPEVFPATPVVPVEQPRSSGERAKGFINETVREFQKVNWPTRDQLRDSTLVVIALTLVLSLFIFGVDTIVSQVFEFLIKLVSPDSSVG